MMIGVIMEWSFARSGSARGEAPFHVFVVMCLFERNVVFQQVPVEYAYVASKERFCFCGCSGVIARNAETYNTVYRVVVNVIAYYANLFAKMFDVCIV